MFVLGLAGTALAAPANTFADVPASHWAYGAVTKLAKAGIVDGYGDDTFRGDKTMTRYEMALIVANAMTKSDKVDAEHKALIDKLAGEFAAELDNLGVRVAKLEKYASPVKFSGDVRLRWIHQDASTTNPAFSQRFRLATQIDVNDKVNFYARWQVLNHNTMGTYNAATANYITDATVNVKQLFPNIDLKAGRYGLSLGETTYYSGTVGGFDGAELTWKQGKTAFFAGYADPGSQFDYAAADLTTGNNPYGNLYYGQMSYKFTGNAKMSAFYMKNQTKGSAAAELINTYGVGFTYGFGDNWKIVADYWKNTADAAQLAGGSEPTGSVYRLQYGTMKPTVPGSWQAFVEYNKLEKNANVATFTSAYTAASNIKSWDVQYARTLGKNVTLEAVHQFDMKKADTGTDYYTGDGTGDTRTRMQVNFLF
ncbi:S-layer homology domain-containing protein [Sporomusa sp.]|uniref:S-layer homology domain-containing protein n=1 Tax=Sporomusa sp. TaxID=2078658 RepID=UPI002C0039B1|nr:S-layer homology domain-containing protein [Sporomusa sp.]HWR05447.1 S-layer homology domain-containing protein [Sporomusa sp.]